MQDSAGQLAGSRAHLRVTWEYRPPTPPSWWRAQPLVGEHLWDAQLCHQALVRVPQSVRGKARGDGRQPLSWRVSGMVTADSTCLFYEDHFHPYGVAGMIVNMRGGLI
jgi:hypothetical protein